MVRRFTLFVLLFWWIAAATAPAAVFIYTVSGTFTSSDLNGAHYQWVFRINADAPPFREDFVATFASASFSLEAAALVISNSIADDGVYPVVDSSAATILIQEMWGPADDYFQINTGGAPNLSLPSFGPLGANFVFTLPDPMVNQTFGFREPFRLFPVNEADVLSVAKQHFPRGLTSTAPRIAMAVPEARLVGVGQVASNAVVSFEGVPTLTYRLERKLNMTDATWQSTPGVADVTVGREGIVSISDPSALSRSAAFYRLRLLP